MSQINKEVIKDLQKLCRVSLSEKEEKHLQEKLDAIALHINQLESLDTKDIPPCIRVQKNLSKSVLREDKPINDLSKEDFIKAAPKHIGGMVQVPVVIEKGEES